MLQITFFFFGILGVIVLAMFVHSYLDKRRIRKGLDRLTEYFKGRVIQESQLEYPRFSSEREGRKLNLFFNEVKAGRHNILYSIYSITVSLPHSLLLIKKDTYKSIQDEALFRQENGEILAHLDIPYEGRSLHPTWAQQVYDHKGVRELILALTPFSSLQLGPDALVIGKPYEGLSDTDPKIVSQTVKTLEKLAQSLE
jgi:hypothetical protein